jgi:hypothetical protein
MAEKKKVPERRVPATRFLVWLFGCLLKYDILNNNAEIFKTEAVLSDMIRVGNALYISSSIGAYVLRNDKLAHYVVEPSLNSRYEVFPAK